MYISMVYFTTTGVVNETLYENAVGKRHYNLYHKNNLLNFFKKMAFFLFFLSSFYSCYCFQRVLLCFIARFKYKTHLQTLSYLF